MSLVNSIGHERWRAAPWLIIAWLFLQPSFAQDLEEDIVMSFGDEEFVTIATGQRQQISRAPSTATVITNEDIKGIGATSLAEALETVPGLHVSVNPITYNPVYVMRGIFTENNAQVLLLVNGVPATHLELGNRGQAWGRMPVTDIQRIEVIRGPGSAVYGADAFAGVINVVTKSPNDIGGTEIGGRVGSFNTREAWLLHSVEFDGWKAGLALDYYRTDGQDRTIVADRQTFVDGMFGTNASLAPGAVNADMDIAHGRFELSKDVWKLRMAYRGASNLGMGAGVNQALDPFGDASTDEYTADLSYNNTEVAENWDVTGRLAYADYNTDSNLWVAPPGADFTPLGGAFPGGVIGKTGVSERNARMDVSAFYHGIKRHELRFGAGYQYQDLYDVRESKNFELVPPLGVPVPLGGIVDVSDTAPFLEEGDRKSFYAFAQDAWSIAPDWELTAGLRYDNYSDFGDTINPRLALVWQTAYNLTSKLLYGRAFRPPSFAELFFINNPVQLGNPNLDPETIDWLELGFDYQPRGYLHTGINFYYYDWRDIIRFAPDPAIGANVAQNTGSQTGYGFEWDFQWDITRDVVLRGNYAYQHTRDEETDKSAGMAPTHQAYLRADWEFHPEWQVDAKLNGVFGRDRQAGDERPDIDDYTTVDLTLRRDPTKSGLGLALSVRNLFNADVREPSPAPGFIPDDLPMVGRNIYGELSYRF